MIDDPPDAQVDHGYDDGELLGYADESQCMEGHRHNHLKCIVEVWLR